tara:strand:- start:207 stop:668 length:462 start_codon:yes stop_codon:yes gene_type:complete
MLSRREAINYIFEKHGDSAVYVTSTGYISRAVHACNLVKDNVFYMQGSMGLAPAIGLGIALNSKRDVVVLSGDAALLMHLGITHTIRDANLSNLFVYVLDNGCHESVGGYKCSSLESKYLGVTEVIKINTEGKKDRVALSCEENTLKIKKYLK